MPEPSSTEPCWILWQPGGNKETANERHYTEQQARDEARTLRKHGQVVSVEQLTIPCITLRCQGCGYWIDEDDEGIIHFESHKEAHEYVTGMGNAGVVFAGDVLVRCCADCPGEDQVGDGHV